MQEMEKKNSNKKRKQSIYLCGREKKIYIVLINYLEEKKNVWTLNGWEKENNVEQVFVYVRLGCFLSMIELINDLNIDFRS